MFVARWGRARDLLRLPPGSRVLDLGCAFGFGTGMLVDRYQTSGHDLSRAYIERARKRVPRARFTRGPADDVPYPDGYFDGVLLLDVLEHVPDQEAVVDEIARLLRPGGRLILSVPNRGALAGLDSLNVYRSLFGDGAPPPTDDPSWPHSPVHRHYSRTDLERLFGPRFRLLDTYYTGLGLAEPVNLFLLITLRLLLRTRRLYNLAQYLYFAVYLLEDLVRLDARGYHLMAEFERV